MKAFTDRLLHASPDSHVSLDMVAHLIAVETNSSPKTAKEFLHNTYDVTTTNNVEYIVNPA